jgi:S-DNA-T family DNA segregation ATPase FtsK/SpoIIIE
MATSKRSPKKPTSKKTSHTSRAKSRPRSKRRKVGLFPRLRDGFAEAVSLEFFGFVLLAVGLFFTAAFLTGRGAVLGDAGLAALRMFLGIPGVLLAPLAAIWGLLLILGRPAWRRALGTAMLLISFSTTLAAGLPENTRFDPESYARAGGIVGSGIYDAVYLAGGTVGAAFALAALYLLGLSLLTGISLQTAFGSAGRAAGRTGGAVASGGRERWRAWRSDSAVGNKSGTRRKTSRQERIPFKEEAAPSHDPMPVEVFDQSQGPEEEFEVVLPESRAQKLHENLGDPATGEYAPPPMSMLKPGSGDPEHDAEGTSRRLTRALSDFGVEAQVVRAVVGPRVTRYELRLGSGVKVSKVRNLQQDIAYALAATEVRILAPIPGKSAVGVEVPNTKAAIVTLGDVFRDYPHGNDWTLPVGLGKDISGRAVFLDLAEMPHLLVAGTTGSGKSVMLNGLLTSLLMTTDPRQVKMVLIDPKRVELSLFGRVPHLITPVVTDVKKASNALSWAVAEMERRYEVLERMGTRSLEGYNDRSETPMPYVVIVIDELADLMMQAAAKVEDSIIRLAQKARAVGIHLVVATQRPSVDVITGMIKANIPSRIAFAVSSQVDSRVIMDTPGAEALLGMGDMLYKPVSAMRPSRVQGAFISEGEVGDIVAASAASASGDASPNFVQEVTQPKENPKRLEEPDDDLLPDAASFVVSTQQASVSAVQRRFRVGYSRAGRIIDALERKGVVGPYEGSKSRSVVASELDLPRIFDHEEANGNGDSGAVDGRLDGSW